MNFDFEMYSYFCIEQIIGSSVEGSMAYSVLVFR